MTTVALLGTLDTKGAEYAFLAERLRAAGVEVLLVDAGTGPPTGGLTADVPAAQVATAAGTDLHSLRTADNRGAAVAAMGRGAAALIAEAAGSGRIHGLLAAGGSGGSSIAAAVMAGLPVGFPKLLVSTMAAGDVAPYVGAKDVTLMYSVVDVAGINRISRVVLGNAAAAVAAMAAQYAASAGSANLDDRPLVAASMFGVTTPAVQTAAERLREHGYEVLVFHATGAGGRALEALAEDGLLAGVLDLTTTELADDLVGGVLSAGPDRLTAAGRRGIPQVVAPGALDMVNFGPEDTVPAQFANRNLFVHNPTVTLMRTTPGEMAEVCRRIAAKLAAATGPTEVFWPLRGVSALDERGTAVRRSGGRRRRTRRTARRAGRHRRPRARDRRTRQRRDVRPGHVRPAPRTDREGGLRWTATRCWPGCARRSPPARPIIGGGAGTGLSAKCAEAGGIDLIIIYNSGRYRMAGRGSLAGLMPYGDANAIVMDMAREVLPVVRDTPVLAGVCGTDPFRVMPRFLDQLAAIGFAGVQNFPTVGLIDGVFRQNLEETGMGFDLEVEMIRLAAQRDLLTCPYVFDPDQAAAMAEAGADVLVPHMGLTTNGTIGAKTALTLEESAERVQAMRDAAVAVNPDVLVLCHGGPIAEPDDAAYVLGHTTGVVGFFGASSMERLPTERALTQQVRTFKAIGTQEDS